MSKSNEVCSAMSACTRWAQGVAAGVAADNCSCPNLQTEEGTSATAGPAAVGDERARLVLRDRDVPTTALGEHVCCCMTSDSISICISTLADSNSEIRCRSLIGSRFRTGDGTSASSHPADLRHRLQIAERETICSLCSLSAQSPAPAVPPDLRRRRIWVQEGV